MRTLWFLLCLLSLLLVGCPSTGTADDDDSADDDDATDDDDPTDDDDATDDDDSAGGDDDSAGDDDDSAKTILRLAGVLDNVTAVWSQLPNAGGEIGVAAGNASCDASFAGAYVCTYQEFEQLNQQGALSALSGTFWVHRVAATVQVDGQPSPPGAGGRCADWDSPGNHLVDGEWVELSGGSATYHFDADTFYDGVATTHAVPGELECDGEIRSVACCRVD